MPERRTLIVTGASSGIGRALAQLAARHGFAVVLVARRAERLAEVTRAISDGGGTCAFWTGDVRSADAPARIVETALQLSGRIDVLVNNAGAGAHGALLETSDAALDAQWQLHVGAPLRIARAALPHVEETHGQLVFVGSGIAQVPVPFYGGYAIAKAAIRAAAVQIRRELRGRGIAVTYVDPGLVATEFHEAIGVERDHHVRAAPPEQVARAILRGIERRSPTVAGTWWQSLGTSAGEIANAWADPTVAKFTPVVILSAAPQGAESKDHSAAPPPVILSGAPQGAESKDHSRLEQTLEPVARRMERVKLQPTFVRDALVPGATLELNELAMRWAGMPNKNERAAMHEVLDALTAGGYLEPMGEETWKVVRAAD
ncbi:MAG: SDR family NAD(P)-dependent oxidoreductase [Candidatus Eremiobacteraeota bacterium]|nr:SDR family NAD(P)-dependent oxidoreductase [Candidatus Eremiobacteraeota bacterium]